MEPLQRIAIALEHIECLLTGIRDSLKHKSLPPPPPLLTPNVETPLLKLWNELAHECFPRAVEHDINSARTKNTALRWAEKPNEDHWKRVILKINASDWCRGHNPSKWKADFDFFVKPENHYKVIEGKYDNKKPTEERRLAGYTESGIPVYERVRS